MINANKVKQTNQIENKFYAIQGKKFTTMHVDQNLIT
jgi:hypothetical protein